MADLTVMQIQRLKPSNEYQKISAGNGLFVGVPTSGDKVFFVRYSVRGQKQRTYFLPKPFGLKTDVAHISLVDARLKAAEIKALAKEGIDYQAQLEQKVAAAQASAAAKSIESQTLEDLYKAWFDTTRRKDGGVELQRYFRNDILPSLGGVLLRDLEESHIRKLLAPVAEQGMNRKAVVLLNILKQMFKWAEGRRPWKLLVDNPAINLRDSDVTQLGYEEVERDRFLSEDEIKLLAEKVDGSGLSKHSQIILWLCLSCGTRIGETSKARWENVDLEQGIWFIPEADTKGKSPEHTVYLSSFARRQFQRLQELKLSDEWCFPDRSGKMHRDLRSTSKQVGDRQVKFKKREGQFRNRTQNQDSLVLGDTDWTPHDLRRTCATMMQSLGVGEHIIERVVNHAEQNRMKRIYQRHMAAQSDEPPQFLLVAVPVIADKVVLQTNRHLQAAHLL